jgi:ABC-type polysaccharide transport system permease subunit
MSTNVINSALVVMGANVLIMIQDILANVFQGTKVDTVRKISTIAPRTLVEMEPLVLIMMALVIGAIVKKDFTDENVSSKPTNV